MAWGQGHHVVPSRPAPTSTPAPDEDAEPKKSSLIEFSTEAKDDPNEGLEFGDSPNHCVCPHCERTVITFLDHEASWVTWLLAFIVWFSLGWMALWVLPLLWPAFKDVVHHCPRCLNVIARQSRIKLPTFRYEVMTLKVGSCAIVLARKYVMILAGLIFVIGAVCIFRSTVSMTAMAPGDNIPKGPPSSLTWEDFMEHCGPRHSMRHRSSVTRAFEEKFRRRTFKWQGEVTLIREGFDVFLLRTKSVVMVRMYPQRFPRRDIPDVALLFGEDRNKEVATLSPGDWVQFEATITSHGHRGDPEVMMMWHIAAAPKPSPPSSTPSREAIEDGKNFAANRAGKSIDAEASDLEEHDRPATKAVAAASAIDSRPKQNVSSAQMSGTDSTAARAGVEATVPPPVFVFAANRDAPRTREGSSNSPGNATLWT